MCIVHRIIQVIIAPLLLLHLFLVCVCVCVEGFQTEVEVLGAEITQLKAALVEREREMCRKVQSVRDEEFRRTVQLKQEK